MLAIAGAAYQGVFHNPLADPYLLGVAAGAGLGATIAIAYLRARSPDNRHSPVAAFVGGARRGVVTYVVGRSAGRERDATALVLAGVTSRLLHGAADVRAAAELRHAPGGLLVDPRRAADARAGHDVALLAPYVVVSDRGASSLYRRVLDVLSLGDERGGEPRHRRAPRRGCSLVVAATVGTAAAVSVSGLIALRRDHRPAHDPAARGTSYRGARCRSRSSSARASSCSPTSSRARSLSPAELPIGVVTAFFGAPFFAIALRTMRGVA